jgi:hypothetical protein
VVPTTRPFDATVSLSDFSPTCAKVKCWLPTQFTPALAKGKTVSLRDKWPMDGDAVLVLCVTKGQTYQDQTGQPVNDWYGILVPPRKLEPGGEKATKAAAPYKGRVGFVGVSNVTGGEGKQPPAC